MLDIFCEKYLLQSIGQSTKVILLTAVLLLNSGCSSMNAKTKQNQIIISNVPVTTESRLQHNCKTGIPLKPESGGTNSKQDEETDESRTETAKNKYGYRNGDKYLAQYQNSKLVKQIMLVEQSKTGNSNGQLFLLIKNEKNEWQEKLKCKAYLGKNGIDKVREGDMKTPTGDFGMLMAFGAKDDPGSLIPYTKLTDTMYLCGDKEYYNQLIDISKVNHICSGNSEHLIRYIPQYNYALFFDFNKENVYGKGSAIFLHCAGNNPFTLGCVSISEENMIQILKTVDINSRICIYAAK